MWKIVWMDREGVGRELNGSKGDIYQAREAIVFYGGNELVGIFQKVGELGKKWEKRD